jgi:hypothetical protein
VSVDVSRRYPPDPAIAGSVRAFVADSLKRLGLARRSDDGVLMAGELVTNAMLHAHTEFEVRVGAVQDGARVEVLDDSATLPMAGTLAVGALSGRGLMLVQSLSTRWGAHLGPEPGKTVWFELSAAAPETSADADLDLLLAMWDEPLDGASGSASGSASEMTEVVIPDLPVQRLLAAKTHMEDLLRELQLILLDPAAHAGAAPYSASLLALAERLSSAARECAEGRRQVKGQALAAAARGQDSVTLHLRLPLTAGAAAAHYRQAVDEATRLADSVLPLATAAALRDHADIRARYLGAVTDRLAPATGAARAARKDGPGRTPPDPSGARACR